MHFGPNECTQCGGVRSAYTSSKYELPSDGVIARLLGYECAFCSDRCFEKALQPYITERFGFDKHPQNDPAIRKIVENYGLIVKLINSNTMHSVEERSKLEEHRAFHLNGLQEALDAWVEGRNNAIEDASDRFTSQWERECRAYHARQSEKSFIEQQRAIEREQRERQRFLEREQAAAERDQRYEEQRTKSAYEKSKNAKPRRSSANGKKTTSRRRRSTKNSSKKKQTSKRLLSNRFPSTSASTPASSQRPAGAKRSCFSRSFFPI